MSTAVAPIGTLLLWLLGSCRCLRGDFSRRCLLAWWLLVSCRCLRGDWSRRCLLAWSHGGLALGLLEDNVATDAVASSELDLPLVLVGLAPLRVAFIERLAADDGLVALVLVGRAGEALEVTFGDDAAAPEHSLCRRGEQGHAHHDHRARPHSGANYPQ